MVVRLEYPSEMWFLVRAYHRQRPNFGSGEEQIDTLVYVSFIFEYYGTRPTRVSALMEDVW